MQQALFRIQVLLWAILAIAPLYALAGSDIESATELDWNALIPKGWNPQEILEQFVQSEPSADELNAEMSRLSVQAPVVEGLNGRMVKLPGYVVPLSFEGTQVNEFLLVPYFGACIHVPPPPANQVVYVKTDKQVEIEGLFAAVWVTGKMSTASVNSELAEAGYTMEAYEVVPYE